MTIRGVRWRKEIPWRLITLPPFHLAASRTQQFAYRSPRHRYIRIRPSLPLKWKLDSSVNRTSIHCLCNHRWRRWIHYSRFYCLINVKALPGNVRQQCKPIGRSRRRTIDADIRRPTTYCIICPSCGRKKSVKEMTLLDETVLVWWRYSTQAKSPRVNFKWNDNDERNGYLRDTFYHDIQYTVGGSCPSCQKLILRNCTAVKQFNLKSKFL